MWYKKSQRGFTLVELAIVLMIIGLLIGGVLRGQELMNNAKITSTIKQIQSYQAAETTFIDIYFNIPGDFVNPGSVIPNCTSAPCNTGGNGNGLIDQAGQIESLNFFLQMAKAHLISGVDETATSWLSISPQVPTGGKIWSLAMANVTTMVYNNYLILRDHSQDLGSTGFTAGVSPRVAAQLDRKMDDGLPRSGMVLSKPDGAPLVANQCDDSANYLETSDVIICTLYIKL